MQEQPRSEQVWEYMVNNERIDELMRGIRSRREERRKIPEAWLDELVRRYFSGKANV